MRRRDLLPGPCAMVRPRLHQTLRKRQVPRRFSSPTATFSTPTNHRCVVQKQLCCRGSTGGPGSAVILLTVASGNMANVATALNLDESVKLDDLCVNTIRTLAIDAIQQANSGHPGTPMGMAPTVYALWQRVLRFDPQDPIWPNRDRFILSAGHASMLLYSILHLTRTQAVDPDYEVLGRPCVSLDDIKHFRQFGSRAAGHPE